MRSSSADPFFGVKGGSVNRFTGGVGGRLLEQLLWIFSTASSGRWETFSNSLQAPAVTSDGPRESGRYGEHCAL
jgi:hypothetical protein